MPNSADKKPIIISQSVPPISLYIDRLEFTQATEIEKSIPVRPPPIRPPLYDEVEILIERKDLTVRVYLGVSGTTPIPAGTQFAGELTVPGLPTFFSVTGPISGDVVMTDGYQSPPGSDLSGNKNIDQRGDNGQSLMFSIPGELCVGTLHCSVAVYPLSQTTNRVIKDFNVPANVQGPLPAGTREGTREVAFTPVKPLRIQPVLIEYTGFAAATLDEAMQALDWVKKVYPISDLTVEPPLTTAWEADISLPENLWALRQQVADLRPAGDDSTIYVGFLSPAAFPPGGFQLSRGIGLVSDHTALTVALNGPATAHAIGRALGLLIIECQTPLPPYAIPFKNVVKKWYDPAWLWACNNNNPMNTLSPVTLPNAELDGWSIATDPGLDPELKTLNNAGGGMVVSMSRSQSSWLPQPWGFNVTIQTDVTGENIVNPQPVPIQYLPQPDRIPSPKSYVTVADVFLDLIQSITCDFSVTEPVKLLLNLTQRTNNKTEIAISVSGGPQLWRTDLDPIDAAGAGDYAIIMQYAMESADSTKQFILEPGTRYQLGVATGLKMDPTTPTEMTLLNNSSQASCYSIGNVQFIPVADTPISETVPVTGNLPAGTIADVGVDNQQLWVYDPESYFDFMSFCDQPWVSPYTYSNLLAKINAL